MLADSLRRGLAAGLVAGLLAGVFALLVGEVSVREAIRLEELAATEAEPAIADAGERDVEVSRTAQQALLPVGTAAVGAAFGGLFGLAFAFFRPRMAAASSWSASWRLGAAAWVVVAGMPMLTAPPNPPAVGDPDTIGSRSGWYLVTIAVTLVVAVVSWWLSERLREAGRLDAPTRQVVVGVAAIGALAVVLLSIPVPDDPIEVPARLLWEFRLSSIGTQLLLWAGIAGVNGWLWHRSTGARAPGLDASVT